MPAPVNREETTRLETLLPAPWREALAEEVRKPYFRNLDKYLTGERRDHTIYPTEDHCRLLGLEPQTVAHIERMARQQTDDTKFTLLSGSNSAVWPRRIEEHQRALAVPFRPLYASASPEVDAFRIFCRTRGGHSGFGRAESRRDQRSGADRDWRSRPA